MKDLEGAASAPVAEQGPTCANCEARPGTHQWVGEGGALAMSHGWFEWWCEPCCLEAQIAFAEKSVGRLVELQAKLTALTTSDASPGGAYPDSDLP